VQRIGASARRQSNVIGGWLSSLTFTSGSMTTADLTNRKIRFDPELDLEDLKSVPELPGKDILHDTARRPGESLKCSKLIQDSHGWCFYIHADDGRKYLVELLYGATERDASRWVLMCSRCAGLRVWEWMGKDAPGLGREQFLPDKAVEILVSHHSYERVAA